MTPSTGIQHVDSRHLKPARIAFSLLSCLLFMIAATTLVGLTTCIMSGGCNLLVCGLLLRARLGDVSAKREIADRLRLGDGVEESQVEAERWYRAAARSGDAAAMYQLAQHLEAGEYGVSCGRRGPPTIGAPWASGRLVESLGWYQCAAEAGHVAAMSRVAQIMYEIAPIAEGVQARELDAAYYWAQQAARRGSTEGLYLQARVLLRRSQHEEGVAHLRSAALAGHREASEMLRLADDLGLWGVRTDPESR